MITKKHLKPLAESLRRLGRELTTGELSETDLYESWSIHRKEVALICSRDNERFDWGRFYEASDPETN
tara:strand:- start:210 stop:413 length:204 start_codon:yes stop_codon:yes gene_type:complete